jgi:hypothetical protein
VKWTRREGRQTIASSEKAYAKVPVGGHDVDFTILDSGGNEATESTTITVYPFGFPSIAIISPMFGSLLGGEVVTITGKGFDHDATKLIVRFGVEQMTGTAIQFLNSTAITVLSPHVPISVPVPVSVETPLEVNM